MTGNWTFTPTTGVGVTVNGLSGQSTANFSNTAASVVSNTAPAAKVAYYQNTVTSFGSSVFGINNTGALDSNGVPASFFGVGTPQSIGFAVGISGATKLQITSAGNTTIPAPTSGVALSVLAVATAGFAGQAGKFSAPNTTGQSNGVEILAGTSNADANLLCANAAGTSNYLVVYGDGGVVIGNPTGGDKGPGTLNIQGTLYVNGVAVTVP